LKHGLGHLLGLAVHDVGGFNKYSPKKSTLEGLDQLRTMRDLIPGMVVTNEPGCYFVEFALKQAYENPEKSKFLNKDLIDQYLDVGGVRLEDNFVVTQNGYEILTDVPRTVEEVEACMRGEDWHKISA
jgi:Xaa-Pro dipeptidase